MGLSIRSNISSITAQRNLGDNQNLLDASLAKLSSGYRITKASDDAAGLGVSANLTAQLRSYEQGARNANDGLSVVQTAEAGLNEITNILIRIRELAMQSASDGVGSNERAFIETENVALQAELTRLDASVEFNNNVLFGSATALTFQVGIRGSVNDSLSVNTSAMNVDAASLLTTAVNLGVDAATSQLTLATLDSAINTVSGFRADLGAAAGRFSSAASTIGQAIQAVAASNSRIRDVDIARETSNLSSAQILVQAGVAVLAQANQAPQVALQLLQ
jgi:flagellin